MAVISKAIQDAAEEAIQERHQSLDEDIRDVLKAVGPLFRAEERQRIADEMAAFARELEQGERRIAASVVKDMWQRVVRRLDR